MIKTYEYRMIPYILAENPRIKRKEAFKLSKQMMKGNKWRTFVVDLSFVGWNILSVFSHIYICVDLCVFLFALSHSAADNRLVLQLGL